MSYFLIGLSAAKADAKGLAPAKFSLEKSE